MTMVDDKRIAAILDHIGLDEPVDLDTLNDGDGLYVGGELATSGVTVPRYLLHEGGTYKQEHHSLHDTPEDAADYSDNQEYADDWWAITLIDLDTGKTFYPKRHTTWEERRS